MPATAGARSQHARRTACRGPPSRHLRAHSVHSRPLVRAAGLAHSDLTRPDLVAAAGGTQGENGRETPTNAVATSSHTSSSGHSARTTDIHRGVHGIPEAPCLQYPRSPGQRTLSWGRQAEIECRKRFGTASGISRMGSCRAAEIQLDRKSYYRQESEFYEGLPY